MKTALFVGTFLDGRVDRVIKYLNFYNKIKEDLGFSQIYVSDNGGTGDQIKEILLADHYMELIRHPYIARGEGHPVYDYLPCWRTVYDYRKLIGDGFEKIIITDDDAFVLSKRLMDYIKNLKTGWTSFWCPKYGFPECALSILCADTFGKYLEFTKDPYPTKNKNPIPIENLLPYTLVNKDFSINRWGETNERQKPWMDGYFQCPTELELIPKME